MVFSKAKIIKVADPDLPFHRLVEAWDQGTDKKTGQRLVVLMDEPQAVRRIAPDKVFEPLRLVTDSAPAPAIS